MDVVLICSWIWVLRNLLHIFALIFIRNLGEAVGGFSFGFCVLKVPKLYSRRERIVSLVHVLVPQLQQQTAQGLFAALIDFDLSGSVCWWVGEEDR